MKTNIVNYAIYDREETPIRTNAFEFQRPKKMGWLAQLLWDALHKLSALKGYMGTVTHHHYGKKEAQTVTEAVLGLLNSALHRHASIDEFAIVMGSAEFCKLTRLEMGPAAMTFETNPVRGYRGEFHGLPIHIVPEFLGVALIPKVIIEKSI